MIAGVLALVLAAALLVSKPVAAQEKGKAASADVIFEGKGLFSQRCSVCHSTTERMYGPMLSKNVVVDREDAVRQQIEQGSNLMPGFRYGLKPAQIDAIILYLSSVEPPKKGSKGEDGASLD